MLIKNGVLLNSKFEFVKADISFENSILNIGENLPCEKETLDFEGCYVLPGFVDTHMHGAVGKTFIDFTEETAKEICEFEGRNGTTTIVPAISAAPEEKMKKAVEYICSKAEDGFDGAKIRGIHLEGPFFAEKFKGAHLPENIRKPSAEEAKRLIDSGNGLVKIITMAPELESGIETVEYIADRGVTVSVGHSDGTYEETLEAFSHGATQTTHTFNAMSPFNHRKPGVAGAAIMSPDVQCELICDFFHVNKDVVGFLCKVKGMEKITMVTDSEVGTGMPDGQYEVNGRTLSVRNKCTYTEDGTIAGGSSVLLDGVRNLVSIGIPLEEAVKAATINGAKAAKIDGEVGSLETGKVADIIVLDKNLSLKAVFVSGKRIV